MLYSIIDRFLYLKSVLWIRIWSGIIWPDPAPDPHPHPDGGNGSGTDPGSIKGIQNKWKKFFIEFFKIVFKNVTIKHYKLLKNGNINLGKPNRGNKARRNRSPRAGSGAESGADFPDADPQHCLKY